MILRIARPIGSAKNRVDFLPSEKPELDYSNLSEDEQDQFQYEQDEFSPPLTLDEESRNIIQAFINNFGGAELYDVVMSLMSTVP